MFLMAIVCSFLLVVRDKIGAPLGLLVRDNAIVPRGEQMPDGNVQSSLAPFLDKRGSSRSSSPG